jgi:hypothetical protein
MTKRHELERGLHCLGTDVVFRTRPRTRLFDRLACQDAERDRDRQCRSRELCQGACDRVGEDVEMGCLTSDQAAERDDRVETARSPEHRDRRRQLEGSGDLELLDVRAFGQRDPNRSLRERAGDLVVPARSHDRDARAACRILTPSRSLPSGRHLSQSSRRMRHCSVSG